MTSELEALEALDLADWAPTRDEMWALPVFHVDGLGRFPVPPSMISGHNKP